MTKQVKQAKSKKPSTKTSKATKDQHLDERSRPTGSRSRFEDGDAIGGGDKTARERDKDGAAERDVPESVAREAAREAGDDGDLTDIHSPMANDRSPRSEDRAEDRGENWVDSLEQRSAEGGPKPEQPIDLTDDETNGRGDR